MKHFQFIILLASSECFSQDPNVLVVKKGDIATSISKNGLARRLVWDAGECAGGGSVTAQVRCRAGGDPRDFFPLPQYSQFADRGNPLLIS